MKRDWKAAPGRLLAYVSDENYVALDGVRIGDFEPLDGAGVPSSHGPAARFGETCPMASYKVTLAKDGYGSKQGRVTCELGRAEPRQFRLLRRKLMGYMWPKWIRSGEYSEIKVSSPEQFQLSLWRYGEVKEYVRTLSWYDEHGPRTALNRSLPMGVTERRV